MIQEAICKGLLPRDNPTIIYSSNHQTMHHIADGLNISRIAMKFIFAKTNFVDCMTPTQVLLQLVGCKLLSSWTVHLPGPVD